MNVEKQREREEDPEKKQNDNKQVMCTDLRNRPVLLLQ